MAEEIAVYKFQEWNMGDGEKKIYEKAEKRRR